MSCTENQNTLCPVFPLPENRAVQEIMTKNVVETEKPHKVWCMRVTCSIRKATRPRLCTHAHTHAHECTNPGAARANTHTHTQKYVMLIALPQQQ